MPTGIDVKNMAAWLSNQRICESPVDWAWGALRALMGLPPQEGCIFVREDQAHAMAGALDASDGMQDGMIMRDELEKTLCPGRELEPLDVYVTLKLDDLHAARLIANQVTSYIWRYDPSPPID